MQPCHDTAFKDVPENKAAMSVLGSSGDTKYIWDPDNPHEVEAAREHFHHMREKGFLVFKLKAWIKTKKVTKFDPKDKRYAYVPSKKMKAVTPTATTGTNDDTQLALEFDPEATRYIAVPPMAGG